MGEPRNENWYSFVVLGAIGLIGAFGQAAFLYNDFVHSYPFKMMDSPPAEFYARIGRIGYYVSIGAAIAGVIYTVKLRRIFVAIAPVVLSPLAYWVTFCIFHVFSGFSSGEMTERNFEGATGYSNISDASLTSFVLIAVGALIAFALGFVLLKAESFWRRSL